MQQSEQANSHTQQANNKKKWRFPKWLRATFWIISAIALLGLIVGGLIVANWYFEGTTDTVQFVTANLLNALIFAAIVAQVLIYRKQWHVMEQSTKIAERALVAGERAFVSANFRQTAIQSLQAGGGITHWSFTPVWTNYGNTPTRNCISHVCHKIFEGDVPGDWDFPDLWEDAPPEDRKF